MTDESPHGELETQLLQIARTAARYGDWDFEKEVDEFLASVKSATTRGSYRRGLVDFKKFLAESAMDGRFLCTEDADAFAAWLVATYPASGATARKAATAVTAFYGHLAGRGLTPENPMLTVDRPKETEYRQARRITRAELTRFFAEADEAEAAAAALIAICGVPLSRLGTVQISEDRMSASTRRSARWTEAVPQVLGSLSFSEAVVQFVQSPSQEIARRLKYSLGKAHQKGELAQAYTVKDLEAYFVLSSSGTAEGLARVALHWGLPDAATAKAWAQRLERG